MFLVSLWVVICQTVHDALVGMIYSPLKHLMLENRSNITEQHDFGFVIEKRVFNRVTYVMLYNWMQAKTWRKLIHSPTIRSHNEDMTTHLTTDKYARMPGLAITGLLLPTRIYTNTCSPQLGHLDNKSTPHTQKSQYAERDMLMHK